MKLNTINKANLLFACLLVLLALIYSFPGILKLRPSGVHQWRQTDCLSITTNYYERGMNFMEPEIHCLISDDLTTGKTIGGFLRPIISSRYFGKYSVNTNGSQAIYHVVVLVGYMVLLPIVICP